MSEKRFKTKYYLKSRQGVVLGVVKVNEEDNVLYWNEVVDLLNSLTEENEQLRKENVFLAKQRTYWKSKCAEWMGVKEENLSLRCVKISEKQFKSTIDEETMCIMPYLVSDNEECFYNLQDCVDLLNEMNEDIQYLNAFLVHKGFAEEYIRWKGDV